jgi:mannose-1-phosphate guanylyltransferase
VKNIIVVKANFSWDDVGSWQALDRHFPKDENGNVKLAHFYGKDTENSIILSDQGVIATMGVKNLIIVQTKKATLVLPKDKASQIKELIKIIAKDKAGKKYL